MNNFNHDSRRVNIAKSSLSSAVCGVLNSLFSFLYRAVFIWILSVEYLGINGLFSGILTLLSLSELGITGAITYRFYKPISENHVQKVGELMNFTKKIYYAIAAIIVMIGLLITPFFKYLISDLSQVPGDINLIFVYLLFLMRTAASYTFSYKQLLLTADQKQYIVSIVQCLINLARYIGQIIVIYATRNYMYSLMTDILVTVIMNYLLSRYVSKEYRAVFDVRSVLAKAEQINIFNDAKANMFHKVGYIVLNGTDSLVLSKYAGLIATGLYSNYTLVLSGLNTVIWQLLASFTASLGNANVELSVDDNYRLYKRLWFANMWIASVTTVCLFCLINPFINLWIGEGMVLDYLSVVCICIQYYFRMTRKVSTSYINASGTFVYDKIRPLIEACINLFVSIYLVKRIGMAGVFLGTAVSHVFTVMWREPFILYHYVFKRSSIEYWKYFGEFTFATVFMSLIFCITASEYLNWFQWLFNVVIIFILSNVILFFFFGRQEEFQYYKNVVAKYFHSNEIL